MRVRMKVALVGSLDVYSISCKLYNVTSCLCSAKEMRTAKPMYLLLYRCTLSGRLWISG